MSDADSLRNFVNAAYGGEDVTDHKYDQDDHRLLQSIVHMMRALMEGAAQDRKIASDALLTERRERTAGLDRVHTRIDDLSETTRRIETGVGTIVEQLRQADNTMRQDIEEERKRPRVAVLDGAGAKVLLTAAATLLGVVLAKTGWLPGWLIP